MTLGSGADQYLLVKDAQTKASIADGEAKAASGSRIRDIEGALSDPSTSKRVRDETYLGIIALICIVSAVIILFFVL